MHWHQSTLYPIYKGKGSYEDLNCWRGVVLLDICSKFTSRIINNKLLALVDVLCGDTEVGYGAGRGVTDATFLVRRLLESWSSTRPADPAAAATGDSLFLCLLALAVGKGWSPFSCMTTGVNQGSVGAQFPMRTGVRQGSVEGPTLFLIFYTFLLRRWRARCSAAFGLWSCVVQLRTAAKTRAVADHKVRLTDCEFADDTLLIEDDWGRFQGATELLQLTLQEFGASLSLCKTEWMEIPGWTNIPPDAAPLPACRVLYVGPHGLPKTGEFRYLGSTVAVDSPLGVSRDIARRIQLAHAAFDQLRHIWRNRTVSRRLKASFLLTCVGSTLLFGSESWVLTGLARNYVLCQGRGSSLFAQP